MKAVICLLGGAALTAIVVITWALSQGILEAMIDRVVTVSSQYVFAKDGGWHFRQDSADLFTDYLIGQTWPHIRPLAIMAVMSLGVMLLTRQKRSVLALTLVWLLLSLGGAVIPRGWRADYFAQAFPPFILLIAISTPILLKQQRAWQIAFLTISLYMITLHSEQIVRPFTRMLTTHTTAETEVLSVIESQPQPERCLWTWGNIATFNYLSGRDPCTSAALNGFVMDDTTFPIVRTRIETMQEIIDAYPVLHIRDRVWGNFPPLQKYADRYLGSMVLENAHYEIYTVDRSMWRPSDVNFGNEIRFIGYDLLPVDGPYCAGDTLTLAMTWEQISRPAHQYQMFVQILTSDEQARVASYDGPPEDEDDDNATNTWVDTGEIRLGDRFDMAIGADAAPGDYKLVLGLYDVETAERAPVLDAGGAPVGSYAILQDLAISYCEHQEFNKLLSKP